MVEQSVAVETSESWRGGKMWKTNGGADGETRGLSRLTPSLGPETEDLHVLPLGILSDSMDSYNIL